MKEGETRSDELSSVTARNVTRAGVANSGLVESQYIRQVDITAVSAETLPRKVARQVIKAVLLGRFGPGQSLLSTGELAKEYRVSRPVVREALGIVAGAGIIENHQGRQSRVRERSLWNDLSAELLSARLEIGELDDILGDCLQLRAVLETEAASLAALRATKLDIEAMKLHLDRLDASMSDQLAYSAHDVAFHDSILRATGNRLFLLLIGQMSQLLDVARAISVTSRPSLIPASQKGHRAIYAAIVARDPDAAGTAMREHLRWAEEANVGDRTRAAGDLGRPQ